MIDNILKKIKIENFRGLRDFEADFGQRTVIAGDNATGKSTVFEAFLWCLFGKDSQDRKDYEIKPSTEGKATDRLTPSVTVWLASDGRMNVLRREFREKWVKHRGEAQETFEGNETLCFWNEAPISVTEYKKRVAEIVDENLFKMLTNPFYFTSLPWKEQRQALYSLVPAATDEEIAAKDEAFKSLLDELSGKSMADFKAERNRALKELRKRHSEIQPRIDECRKCIIDVTATKDEAEQNVSKVKSLIDDIEKAMFSAAKAVEEHSARLSAKRSEINSAQLEADKLLFAARNERERRIASMNSGHDILADEIDGHKKKLEKEKKDLINFNDRTKRFEDEIERLEMKHHELRNEYLMVNKEEFDEDELHCPTCGQIMPEAKRDEARIKFNDDKAARLDSITKMGNENKQIIENLRDEIIKRTVDSKRMSDTILKMEAEIDEMTEKLAGVGVQDLPEVNPSDVKGYNEAIDKVKALKKELAEMEAQEIDDTRNQMREQRIGLQKQYAEAQDTLNAINGNERLKNRISELEVEGRNLAQQIAEYERSIFMAERFEHAKVEDLEGKINGLFDTVKWKLFDYTLDGNVVETCVAIVGNALYPVANSAAKLNAGLDIIHILSQHHGIRCPIFVDNAEGVTAINGYDMQIVELYVLKDASLRVNIVY